MLTINTTIAMHYVTTRLLVTHVTCASLLAAERRPGDRTERGHGLHRRLPDHVQHHPVDHGRAGALRRWRQLRHLVHGPRPRQHHLPHDEPATEDRVSQQAAWSYHPVPITARHCESASVAAPITLTSVCMSV